MSQSLLPSALLLCVSLPHGGLVSRAQDECSVIAREITLLESSTLATVRMVTVLHCRGPILQVEKCEHFGAPGLVTVTSAYKSGSMDDSK